MSKISNVVIIGRMNVGKSTLFNRLAPNVRSIALDYEGVTRDAIKDVVTWKDATFNLIDSGGIHLRKTQDPLFEKVREKVLALIKSADLLVFMVDGVVGVLPEDREISQFLHKSGKPTILVINKADSKLAQENRYEFDQLGYTVIVPISAEHGTGIHDFLDAIVDNLPTSPLGTSEGKPAFKVVFLGKPNVGKSSLMNALLQEERSIVSDIPGTTREAVAEQIMFYKEAIELIDTPGIRRKRSVTGELEPLMVKSSFHALKDADIIVLLIDGSESALADQELKLAFYAFTEQYKALILVINKQDLVTENSKAALEFDFEQYKHLIKHIPVLTISCKTGKNVGRVLPTIQKVWQRYSQTFDSAALQALFIGSLHKKPLFHVMQPLRIYEVAQLKTAPITILLKVNEPAWFGPSQLSFFENILRSEYDIQGVPIKFIVRKKPIAPK